MQSPQWVSDVSMACSQNLLQKLDWFDAKNTQGSRIEGGDASWVRNYRSWSRVPNTDWTFDILHSIRLKFVWSNLVRLGCKSSNLIIRQLEWFFNGPALRIPAIFWAVIFARAHQVANSKPLDSWLLWMCTCWHFSDLQSTQTGISNPKLFQQCSQTVVSQQEQVTISRPFSMTEVQFPSTFVQIWTYLLHSDDTTLKSCAIEIFNCAVSIIRIFHGHKPKSSGLTGAWINNQPALCHLRKHTS